jgi:hypothetical protein
MTVVEYFCQQKSIESRVARSNALGVDRRMESLFFAYLDDLDCSMILVETEVIGRQRRGDTFEDISIGLSISHIASDILDLSVSSILSDVVVDPSKKDVLVSKFAHNILRLILPPKNDDLRNLLERNLA